MSVCITVSRLVNQERYRGVIFKMTITKRSYYKRGKPPLNGELRFLENGTKRLMFSTDPKTWDIFLSVMFYDKVTHRISALKVNSQLCWVEVISLWKQRFDFCFLWCGTPGLKPWQRLFVDWGCFLRRLMECQDFFSLSESHTDQHVTSSCKNTTLDLLRY